MVISAVVIITYAPGTCRHVVQFIALGIGEHALEVSLTCRAYFAFCSSLASCLTSTVTPVSGMSFFLCVELERQRLVKAPRAASK